MKYFLLCTYLICLSPQLLAQKTPTTFLPGVISTEKIEYYSAFDPVDQSLYFVRRNAVWGDFNDKTPGFIYFIREKEGEWQTAEIASFSGQYSDGAPFISEDGKHFFFTSNRPHETKEGNGADIWLMEKVNGFWSTPRPLMGNVNSQGVEYSPVLTRSGRLYFASTGLGGLGQGDIFSCDFDANGCNNIQNLGEAVNSPTGEWNVFVDPEETYMIFEASGRIYGRDYGDLYISFRKEGVWQKAQYLQEMNSEGSDLAVRLSLDGKWFYYAQSEGGRVDIKRISSSVIEKYR